MPSPTGQVSFRQLVGDGRLTVTIEAEERSARYQGIVSLQGANLAECLENYFATSEQLPTRIALAADASSTGGVLLQKIPGASAQGEAQAAVSQAVWEDLQPRVAMLDATLLLRGSAEQVLQQVCAEHDCRLFQGSPVRFACRCSEGRVAGLLRSLGPAEMHSILAEQGAVTVTCEFCGRPYRFDSIDVERLFTEGANPEAPHSSSRCLSVSRCRVPGGYRIPVRSIRCGPCIGVEIEDTSAQSKATFDPSLSDQSYR
jgi:molecular chaperone Hsp33